MNAFRRGIRRLVVIAAVLGGLLLPSVNVSLSAGLLAAVLTLVVVVIAVSLVRGVAVPPHRRARAALSRLVPTDTGGASLRNSRDSERAMRSSPSGSRPRC